MGVLVRVFVAFLGLVSIAQAATTYTLSIYTTDPVLYADLMANATNQYEGTLKKSTYANLYTLTVTGKKPAGPPPITPVPIETGTAFDRCFVHGYAFGMEDERKEDILLINSVQSISFSSSTCGGFISASTSPAVAFMDGCHTAYNVIRSTITQRDGLEPPILVPPFPAP